MSETLGIQEAAALLRINPDTLQQRVKAGEIPGAKLGREWVFLEVDLIAYIRENYQANKLSKGEACRSTKVNAQADAAVAMNQVLNTMTTTRIMARLLYNCYATWRKMHLTVRR